MKICVFCSANSQIDAAYFQLTEELGRWAARNGHVIVFGGVNQGLMECLAKAVKEAGGQTLGVVPSIVEKTGRTSQYNDRVLTCDNLSERKQLMLDDLQQRGMVRGRWRDYICVANNLDEIEQLII